MRTNRPLALPVRLALVLGLLLAACTGATSSDGDPAEGSTDDGSTSAWSSGTADASTPPDWPWDRIADGEDVPEAVPIEQIRSGGPPPDGIPPIDEPQFGSVAEAGEWLSERDPVMVVERDGETKVYPLAIMTFHEIVNDEVGGVPLVVTYCPLCNSGIVFDRTVDGEPVTFGTSGRLHQSNLVMYDRPTRTLWSQFTGEAIVGSQVGTSLQRVASQIVAFSTIEQQRPDALVLTRDTGHSRPYGSNPYVGYDSSSIPFLFDGDTGGPLPQMARVLATGDDDDPVAIPWDLLQEQRVVADEVDGQPLVALWAPGTASALDDRAIAESSDVGATGLFRPQADDTTLTLRPQGEELFVDDETGSTWSVVGTAVDGPLEGTQLERVPHDDTFWFVQFAFRPDTRVVDGA